MSVRFTRERSWVQAPLFPFFSAQNLSDKHLPAEYISGPVEYSQTDAFYHKPMRILLYVPDIGSHVSCLRFPIRMLPACEEHHHKTYEYPCHKSPCMSRYIDKFHFPHTSGNIDKS